jgi:hypothetical protein
MHAVLFRLSSNSAQIQISVQYGQQASPAWMLAVTGQGPRLSTRLMYDDMLPTSSFNTAPAGD